MKRTAALLSLLATLTAATVTAGCADTAEQTADPVSLLVAGTPDELAAYRALAAAYEQATPGARVTLIEASTAKDLMTKVSTSIAGNSPPDLFLINYRNYGQFAVKGALAPVTARLAASASLHEQDFYPQAMGAFRWQGEQMCLPQNISSLAVYYNRTLFKQYEVAEPAAGWHWNDLVATAQALTRDAGGRTVRAGEPETAGTPVAVHGLGIAPELIRMAPLIWSNGGDIVDDPNAPTRLTLDTPQAREVMQDFLELPRIGVVPSDVEVEAQDYEARFAAGKLAMFVSSRRVTTAFRAITGFEWDVAPLPQYRAPANILHSDAYCMTRTSANQDAAWRFLEYALSDPGATLMAKTGRTVPSRISVATSAAFLSPGTPPGRSQIFLDTIPALRPVPTIATWPEIEDATGKVLENAFFHGDPLDKVIRDLDAATRTVFERGAASR
ncbi:ABC transporter substrate-binding protein [Catellatospora bangladeshensis]|uniref:Sugar ABC transporter substrate-binding protein n=1 Tax=Catellatospora bangladeshensis TaxID=310355 RepID=A0A8J3NJJ9_9ACTN|nr:sugar ABC transporter substrate-binding protein [Catellatospora bangladeshensis]GIF83545.1 sugar ABC transporter substrate-binding protein [Catellatospora bangladeshensis]